MSDQNALYLDTTAAADRIFGLRETRQALQDICQDHVLLSSVYVWGEFRRTFIYDAIVSHAVLLNSMARGESWPDGLQRIRRIPGVHFKPRRKDRAWDIMAYLQDPPISSLEDAVDRLEKDIRYNLRHLFFRGLQIPLRDSVHCKMTDENPTEIPPAGPRGYARFKMQSACSKRSPRDCGIVTFWKDNVEALHLVADMSIPNGIRRATRKELEKVKAEAARVANALDGKTAESHGRSCHVLLADLVITLECPPHVPIVTSNERHFAPLCSALSRPQAIHYR